MKRIIGLVMALVFVCGATATSFAQDNSGTKQQDTSMQQSSSTGMTKKHHRRHHRKHRKHRKHRRHHRRGMMKKSSTGTDTGTTTPPSR